MDGSMWMKKKKKNCDNVGQKAWNLLRMALLWARKGGVFKRRLMMELRVFPKFLKSLAAATSDDDDNGHRLHYFERELSFDKTPIFNVKMRRPSSMRFSIPCLNPPAVSMDFHDHYYNHHDHNIDDDDDDDDEGIISAEEYGCHEDLKEDVSPLSPYGDEAVDIKADEFIAKFYQQIKLQRQISYMQYHDMLNRGTS